MLTEQQRKTFEDDGVLPLPGAVAVGDARRMAAQILERPGSFQELKRAGAFNPVGASAIPEALDDLFGPAGWVRPQRWGGHLLHTEPGSDSRWDVPTDGWHIHLRAAEEGMADRINLFIVLSTLRPRGGGTLLLAGSHRLVALVEAGAKTKALRRALGERDPWLAELWSRAADPTIDRRSRYLDAGTVVDGVPLRVIEVTGEPGDAYLMRSDTFHAKSPNVRDEPRLMLVTGVSASA